MFFLDTLVDITLQPKDKINMMQYADEDNRDKIAYSCRVLSKMFK